MAAGSQQGPSRTGRMVHAVAPSDTLRKWYGHDPAKFEEFGSRYRKELDEPERAAALRHLRRWPATIG